MEINDFIRKVEQEFDDVEEGSLEPQFNFRESEGWSSMHALVMIALIDVEYEVTVGGDDLRGMKTIQDLYDFVVEKRING